MKTGSHETVHHPAHYGGADNPYEAIKVMEAWLTPEEFVGGLKFSFFTYQARARQKNGLEDHEKAAWYQARLIEFIKRTGYVERQADKPGRLFWTEEFPDPVEDAFELLISSPMWRPIAVHSSIAPHCSWLVRFPTGDADGEPDGDDFSTFESFEEAKNFCDDAEAEKWAALMRRLVRGHTALTAQADIVIVDGIVTKNKTGMVGVAAAPDLIEIADVVIENGKVVKPAGYDPKAPLVPRPDFAEASGQ